MAAVMNASFVPLMKRVMPKLPPQQKLRYRDAMKSLWTLFAHNRYCASPASLARWSLRPSAAFGRRWPFCFIATTGLAQVLRAPLVLSALRARWSLR